MTETEAPETPAADPRLLRMVDKTLELLQADPRTRELAAMIPSLLQMAAMQSGLDPATAQLEPQELSDVFQAVYDAWGEAAVDVADREFREASLASGHQEPR